MTRRFREAVRAYIREKRFRFRERMNKILGKKARRI